MEEIVYKILGIDGVSDDITQDELNAIEKAIIPLITKAHEIIEEMGYTQTMGVLSKEVSK